MRGRFIAAWKARRLSIVALIALLAFPSITDASSLDLKLGTGDYYAPFTGRKLQDGGMATEIVRTIFQDNKIFTSLSYFPWNRVLSNTHTQDLDASYPWVKNPQREEKFLFSDPIFTTASRLFSIKGRFEPASTRDEDVKGSVICVPIGYASFGLLEGWVNNGIVKLHQPSDMPACFKLLLNGRVDGLIENPYTGALTLKALEQEGALVDAPFTSADIKTSPFTLGSYDLHLIVSKDHPQASSILDRFNIGLKAMRKEGGYDRIEDKHLGPLRRFLNIADPLKDN